MGWLLVFVSAGFELVGVVGLKKYSERKTLMNTILFVGGFSASYLLLYAALDHLQLSIAYAVWIGVGTAGAVLINMIFFNESKSLGRIISLSIIVVGVVGLKAVS